MNANGRKEDVITTAQKSKREPFVLFQIADTTYAIRAHQVRWLEMVEQVTRVPNAPPYVEGVAYSRGQVIPVINLRQRFGYPQVPYTPRSRLIIADVDGRLVAMTVDSAREFVYLPVERFQPPPQVTEGVGGEYLEGVLADEDRLILLLDLPKLLPTDMDTEFAASSWSPMIEGTTTNG
ncbi:MAG: purine-binding chemotaxis protein CheW [Anaerolineae bacterium]|nr:purine-binding chemotaxis protein CheW [Anaerolineae bacterium]